MVKPCPGCGAATVPEARFCRLCGAPLHAGSSKRDGEAPVSPLAQTIPLAGEGRATDGLHSEDARRAASDTSRVGRAEMENILQRAVASSSRQLDGDGNGDKTEQQKTIISEDQPPTATAQETAAQETAPAPVATIASSSAAASSTGAGVPTPPQPSTNVRARRMWQVAAVVLLCVALFAVALAFILSRRASSTDGDGSSAPISISDQKQLVNDKLAEADTLLASGEFNRAITVLRAAVKLDPSSLEAHMRLGDTLEKTGARSEAIEEYRAATESNPKDISAWRSLAAAQFEEKLYPDAAESYRRVIEAAGEADADDETRLAYADALRLAGRTDEARAAYQKISASAPAAVAQAARQHLAELGPVATSANTERPRETDERAAQPTASPEVIAPAPTPTARATPSPASQSVQAEADAFYFKAQNIVNGREPKKLSDGELVAALNYYSRVQVGPHAADARRNEARLGREYDRRRKR